MQLRSYQEEAVNSFFHYFESGKNGNPLIAMPTGTGKSLVIAELIKRILFSYPTQRILMLTHVKELLEQNAEKLLTVWPTAPLGIFSSGLGQKNYMMPITFGGVASVIKSIELFGWIDLIFIDECHLLSDNDASMYQQIIAKLKLINPFLKVIGFTATAYRLRMGELTDGTIFTDYCFNVTDIASFNRFIDEGFLAPLVPRKVVNQYNLEGVGIAGGEFVQSQMAKAVDKEELTYLACKEWIEQAYYQRCWMAFAASIEHSEHIAAVLNEFGISAYAVHSKKSNAENDELIKAFKAGEFRCIVNKNKLTTGFDCPMIDAIGMFRPTYSASLWVQMLGRGTRPADGKSYCLVSDFAGNTARLGPINDPVKPRKPGDKKGGAAPVKICTCGIYNHTLAKYCGGIPKEQHEAAKNQGIVLTGCGKEFEFASPFGTHASNLELIRSNPESDLPINEWFDVQQVIYTRHKKEGKPDSIKVQYICGLQKTFVEWVHIEHAGFARKRAEKWWKNRHAEETPSTVTEALEKIQLSAKPKRILVHTNVKLPEVINYEF